MPQKIPWGLGAGPQENNAQLLPFNKEFKNDFESAIDKN
jgi:hypothetical protein